MQNQTVQFAEIKTVRRSIFASLIVKQITVGDVSEQIWSYLFLSDFQIEFP